jgi:hypothetical protein
MNVNLASQSVCAPRPLGLSRTPRCGTPSGLRLPREGSSTLFLEKEQKMKKETPKKLGLNVETLRDLDLSKVPGGGTPLPASIGSRTC